MRLDKYLADMKVGTRSEVKDIIRKKRIRVNGEIIKDAAYKVNDDDTVTLDDEIIGYVYNEYYLLYKPAGYLSATEDNRYPVVMDLIDSKRKDLSPVGRLDLDTEGLLLITNDGQLNHDLLSPKNHVKKKYYVELDTDLPDNAEKILSNPIEFEDFTSKPAEYEKISDRSAYLTISEGKYHQVKRMFEKVGCTVVYLKRVAFGSLNLDGLEKGEFRALTSEEIEELKSRQ